MQALPLATTTLTTIDPAVESAARARVEQPQHPEATIAITTAEFDPADRRRRERRRREAENGAVRRPVSAPQPRGRAPRRAELERRSSLVVPSAGTSRIPTSVGPFIGRSGRRAGRLSRMPLWA